MSDISFCPGCGSSVETDSKFCPCCGACLDSGMNSPQSDFSSCESDNVDTGYDYGDYDYDDLSAAQNGADYTWQHQTYMNMSMGMGTSPNMQQDSGGGCAIAGLVLGILSIILCCFLWVNVLMAVIGLVLSIAGIRSYRYKGAAVAGIICSICGMLMGILEVYIFF